MKKPARLDIATMIPGGIKPADFVHEGTNDGSCSRCRKDVPEDQVPLMVWLGPTHERLLIYCETCLEAWGDEAPIAPR